MTTYLSNYSQCMINKIELFKLQLKGFKLSDLVGWYLFS